MYKDFERLNEEFNRGIEKMCQLKSRLEANMISLPTTQKKVQIDGVNFQTSKPEGFFLKLKFLLRVAKALFRNFK